MTGGLALRADRVERLAATVRQLSRHGPFSADDRLAALAGTEPDGLRRLLLALGYRAVIDAGVEIFRAPPRRRREPAGGKAPRPPRDGNPFAKLRQLKLA